MLKLNIKDMRRIKNMKYTDRKKYFDFLMQNISSTLSIKYADTNKLPNNVIHNIYNNFLCFFNSVIYKDNRVDLTDLYKIIMKCYGPHFSPMHSIFNDWKMDCFTVTMCHEKNTYVYKKFDKENISKLYIRTICDLLVQENNIKRIFDKIISEESNKRVNHTLIVNNLLILIKFELELIRSIDDIDADSKNYNLVSSKLIKENGYYDKYFSGLIDEEYFMHYNIIEPPVLVLLTNLAFNKIDTKKFTYYTYRYGNYYSLNYVSQFIFNRNELLDNEKAIHQIMRINKKAIFFEILGAIFNSSNFICKEIDSLGREYETDIMMSEKKSILVEFLIKLIELGYYKEVINFKQDVKKRTKDIFPEFKMEKESVFTDIINTLDNTITSKGIESNKNYIEYYNFLLKDKIS